ncbi:adenylate/guanylate cyclase domain-containing protein [Mucilaginibacter aquariorum]|uniref:Adenylate/guanylate cyclase domain-containing protein n=1 Tax=Mucilaginibacter aquariorum TaxID=2967225 RepID=A0ABT1T6Z6_9SPHI|nr:adenylate/guanylate cyclase domain-containing protein [Mucilaginibacter aquariorum]MCQ6960406.1 adenylate/guanylate cyclase domain-containing protein [Mucilaginibacter aquariorum]
MNIYEDYLQPIRKAIAADGQTRTYSEFAGGNVRNKINLRALNEAMPEKRLLPSLEQFADAVGLKPDFTQKLGSHPDFAHLKHTEDTEEHYIVSMFVDVRRSTQLYGRYEPATVFVINNAIQRAAIHTALIFGGYIHRLQGDGLFAYFGGKNMSIKDAVNRALQFASVYSYFVKHDLKEVFEQQGIEQIYTRIGVDLGYDEDVVWAMAGIGEISEVTTFSLHTNLASKMQANAVSNGIVIGDHIKKEAALLQEFFTPVCLRTGKETDRYIFEIPKKGFRYTQHDFDWLKFLKKQDYIATDFSGNIQLKRKQAPAVYANSNNLAPIAVKSKPYYDF